MRLGIQQRIGAVIALLLSISLLVIGGAHFALENLHNLANGSVAFFLESDTVANLRTTVDSEMAPIRLLFRADPNKAYEGWRGASEKVDGIIAKLKKDPVLTREERRFLASIARHQNEIEREVKRLFSRSAHAPTPGALDAAISSIERHADSIDELVDRWRRVDGREVSAGMERIDSVHDIERNLIFGALFVLLIGAAIAFSASRSISKPLIELHQGVDKISKGDLEYTSKIKTGDEIEDLAEAFNRLAYNLRHEEKTASEIQRRLLPQKKLRAPGVRVHARQIHAKLVGGDWFDYYRFEDEVRLLIADASGKGMPGALLATVGMSAIRSEPKLANTIESILRKTNKTVTNRFGSTDFITLFSAQLSLNSRRFVYINCGHEPALYYNANHRSWGLLPCHSGLPLGISAELFDPIPQVLMLNPGDKLILYTDGLHDVRDKKGLFLTMDTILGWLNKHEHLAIEILTDELVNKAVAFNDGPLMDDITLLGLELSHSSSSVT